MATNNIETKILLIISRVSREVWAKGEGSFLETYGLAKGFFVEGEGGFKWTASEGMVLAKRRLSWIETLNKFLFRRADVRFRLLI